jgi:arylsulfatase A-like enzyme
MIRTLQPSFQPSVRGLLSVLLVLVTGLGACDPPGDAPRRGFALLAAVAAGDFAVGVEPAAGLAFDHGPRPARITADHERRPAVLLPPGAWSWRGRVPEAAQFQAGAALAAPLPGAVLEVTVTVGAGATREVAAVARATERQWLDVGVDLGHYAGRWTEIEVRATVTVGGAAPPPDTLIAWAPAGIVGESGQGGTGAAPNVLFIVIDTLRADHLSCYGYERPTTPHIDRLLAERGVLLEDAYSQAPWTLPSVISFLTGHYPGEILAPKIGAFRFPEALPTLAEQMHQLGYETAGFNANPALHDGLGFDRGFTTFFAPPADFAWFQRHADDLNRRALPWLAAHQDRPFFLYLQYLDPHDPYHNPEIVNGRSPFYPDYGGNLTGTHVHGVYGGAHPLEQPEEDVAHLTALYDSEVHYVDRFVGQVIEALRPEVLANTLIVLTSDHGEELYDHGGWKHGQSLHQEQIRVPLLFRWDGRLPAGQRLGGEVELVDLMPTLVAAAGGKADPRWVGVDLLPALTGAAPLPRRPAFAQHLSFGPLRATAVLDGQKLMAFDRQTPFAPVDSVQAHVWQLDLERFPALELFDLKADPGERRNLLTESAASAASAADVDRLARVIHHRFQAQGGGLRLAASGVPVGQRLVARVRFASDPTTVEPFFLADADRATVEGAVVRLEIVGDPLTGLPQRGLVVEGENLTVTAVEVTLEGVPLGPEAVQWSAGERWPEAAGDGPALQLWQPKGRAVQPVAEEDPETRQRLQALGYLGS